MELSSLRLSHAPSAGNARLPARPWAPLRPRACRRPRLAVGRRCAPAICAQQDGVQHAAAGTPVIVSDMGMVVRRRRAAAAAARPGMACPLRRAIPALALFARSGIPGRLTERFPCAQMESKDQVGAARPGPLAPGPPAGLLHSHFESRARMTCSGSRRARAAGRRPSRRSSAPTGARLRYACSARAPSSACARWAPAPRAARAVDAGSLKGCPPRAQLAIYSPSDRLQPHRYKADESYEVGADKPPVAAYLDVEGILAVAKEQGVDAIHPGAPPRPLRSLLPAPRAGGRGRRAQAHARAAQGTAS